MKNILIIAGLAGLLLVGSSSWLTSLGSDDPEVISLRGMHTHPRLAIYVKGEPITIPMNMGIGMQYATRPTFDPAMRMTAMHTHEDTDGTIHLEFPGRVMRSDTKLKNFFAIWGKDMMSFGEKVTMTVNGNPSSELGEYEMNDGDRIELRYE